MHTVAPGVAPDEASAAILASPNPVTLTLATMLLAFALYALRVPILELTELKTYDLRVRARAARSSHRPPW